MNEQLFTVLQKHITKRKKYIEIMHTFKKAGMIKSSSLTFPTCEDFGSNGMTAAQILSTDSFLLQTRQLSTGMVASPVTKFDQNDPSASSVYCLSFTVLRFAHVLLKDDENFSRSQSPVSAMAGFQFTD